MCSPEMENSLYGQSSWFEQPAQPCPQLLNRFTGEPALRQSGTQEGGAESSTAAASEVTDSYHGRLRCQFRHFVVASQRTLPFNP